ncbi:MAG: PHB depolymerase family esterase [Pseudomonadales bacterium]|nr:PHB depolymerase family esterase [Pseudomonadales bacterium]
MKKWLVRLVLAIAVVLLGLPLAVILAYTFLSHTNGDLISSGDVRRYRLYIPESYDPATPSPLVISLHAAFLSPGSQQRITGWNEVADREGFIVVYPQATGFPRTWRGLSDDEALARETRFFRDLIDKLSADFNIDAGRIYANGFSNGAAMTFKLSCTMADRIAAFGMVALPVSSWEQCYDRRPVSAILFQGSADPLVPYAGGANWLTESPLPAFEDWFAGWGERNRCDGIAVFTPASGISSRRYSNCAAGTEVVLYTLEGAGHVWPGGLQFAGDTMEPYTDSVDATVTMWQFFQGRW